MTHIPSSAEIFDVAQQAPSRASFRREIALRLQRAIGGEVALFHDIAPPTLQMSTVLGLDELFLGRARDQHSGPYSEGLLTVLRSGRAVVDAELFGQNGLRETVFYNEVSRPAGIAQLLYALISFRGLAPAFVALGRPDQFRFRDRAVAGLGRLAPTLTLADAALANREAHSNRAHAFELTSSQQELLAYVRLGLTNRLIGSALGISPNTVRNRLAALFQQCGVSSRAELVHVMRD